MGTQAFSSIFDALEDQEAPEDIKRLSAAYNYAFKSTGQAEVALRLVDIMVSERIQQGSQAALQHYTDTIDPIGDSEEGDDCYA